jgi:predicted nucleic acid-binding protein
MTTSKKIYLAPDVLIAFIDRSHPKHDQAAAFFRFFALEQYHLYIDNISLYESYMKIDKEVGNSIAKDLLRTMMLSNITILYPEESDMKMALKVFLNDKSGDLSFQKSFMAVMADRKHIGQICTFEYIHSMFGLTIFYIPL